MQTVPSRAPARPPSVPQNMSAAATDIATLRTARQCAPRPDPLTWRCRPLPIWQAQTWRKQTQRRTAERKTLSIINALASTAPTGTAWTGSQTETTAASTLAQRSTEMAQDPTKNPGETKLTTNAGAPVPDNQNAMTAGPRGHPRHQPLHPRQDLFPSRQKDRAVRALHDGGRRAWRRRCRA